MNCERIAADLLAKCIGRAAPAELPRELLADECSRALFGIFVEGLGDRFEPALCDAYAALFAQAIQGQDAGALAARYRRIRAVRRAAARPDRVLVLSRVTLGADVAVTSVVLDAAKRAYPDAEIVFAGPRKNFELFAADARLSHAAIEYPRGSLRDRLSVWEQLKALAAPGTLVLDPDSRLTQLGLLTIGEERDYHLFESRSYGGDGLENLPALAAMWARETVGIAGAKPYVALPGVRSAEFDGLNVGIAGAKPYVALSGAEKYEDSYIAISLGVGENAAKRIAGDFERQLLGLLSAKARLIVDRGAGGEEAERVQRAAADYGARITFWDGSFAGFAQIIAGSSLYAGYDSAGQHVAAACGVPLVTIFAGFPAERMFYRWRPAGPGVTVLRVDHPDPGEVLARVAQAIA
ncbi:MAG: hypothetical protein ABI759_22415 [Candidatus Solibacter sp.]